MELVHFSDKVITKVKLRKRDKRAWDYKPHGFWVSDEAEHGWSAWCKAEDFQTQRLKYAHKVEIDKSAKILHIASVKKLDEFTEKYSKEQFPNSGILGIDWEVLYGEYDGIIITPYQWKRRLGQRNNWYYGWDCASGCIWNEKVIKIELKNT